MFVDKALKKLLQNNPAVWCASESAGSRPRGITTGFTALDEMLPGGGWPQNSLIEILLPRWGSGELQLLLPTLLAMSQQAKWLVWLGPPFIPYAPALVHAGVDLERLIVIPPEKIKTETLWAMEKILRTRSCGLVMAWPQRVSDKAMRRLQLAAEEGESLGFIFRNHVVHSSPAALRISLNMLKRQLQVKLLKARGSSRYTQVLLDLPII